MLSVGGTKYVIGWWDKVCYRLWDSLALSNMVSCADVGFADFTSSVKYALGHVTCDTGYQTHNMVPKERVRWGKSMVTMSGEVVKTH